MAKMVPPEVGEHTSSKAEQKIFGLLRQDLGEDWIVLHSLGLVGHQSKPWAEIDFVLIGPPGVFCLEVKGGRIARRAGRYEFTDRYGHTQAKNEGPFEQVAGAAAALRNHLFSTIPKIRRVAVGYGVVTPDILFDIEGPDIEPAVLYDERDVGRRFSSYVRRLSAYWHERLENQFGHPMASLSEADRQAVLDELRGDFDFRPSLRTRIGLVKDELVSLTREQYSILDSLQDNERAIIRGGAGTGKTLLAVEEALRRAAAGRRVLLCCYNKSLARYLRESVKLSPGIEAANLHSLMASAVAEAGLKHKLPPAQEDDLFAVFYPELCPAALRKLHRYRVFDDLIIDEGQDLLRTAYLDVFDALLKGGLERGTWRLFLDPHQDIFQGLSTEGMKRVRAANPAHFRLSLNCRNTKPIAVAVRIISSVLCEETLRAEGPDVEHLWFREEPHQLHLIADTVNRMLAANLTPRDIILLSRRRLENSCLRYGLPGVPFQIRNFTPDSSPPADVLRFATVNSFKGLESDAVLFVDIDDLEQPESLQSLYVGGSRARAYLALFLDEQLREPYRRLAEQHALHLLETCKPEIETA